MFTAIDVETANPDLASICQVGIATVRGDTVTDVWTALVDPRMPFHPYNVAIHGIDAAAVAGAPTFSEMVGELESRLCPFSPAIVVSHTSFDRVSLSRAGECSLPVTWLDSARITRRAWPEQYARKGYGLATIAHDLGIEFRHHDAGEDARVAAEIVLRASAKMQLGIEDWFLELSQCKVSKSGGSIRRGGNVEGPLCGETLTFTGALSLTRKSAADLAAAAGCAVHPGVTNETTLLVVGTQDIARLAGHEKSAKHRKAEALIEAGYPIRIIAEADFMRLCAIDGEADRAA
jgi:DNA polymerase-3 subunit epsilon